MKIPLRYQRLVRDVALLAASIAFAVWLAKSGTIEEFLAAVGGYAPLIAFIAGFFFTSLFTMAPASIALAALGTTESHAWIALWGAIGAVCGDLLLFLFVRDHLSRHLAPFFSHGRWNALRRAFRRPFLHWLLPLGGALIIASPLPDELGLAMMGISRISLAAFAPISFAMNFLGIILIEYVAGKAI